MIGWVSVASMWAPRNCYKGSLGAAVTFTARRATFARWRLWIASRFISSWWTARTALRWSSWGTWWTRIASRLIAARGRLWWRPIAFSWRITWRFTKARGLKASRRWWFRTPPWFTLCIHYTMIVWYPITIK